MKRLIRAGLRLFFRWLYHPLAWTYDWVATIVSAGWWKTWVMSVLPFLPGKRILELGYGPGHLQGALLERGIETYGVDESFQMARQARRRIRKNGGTARLVRGLSQGLPFLSQSFDQVVATFPSEYINDPATLAEIRRVLVRDGLLVVLPGAWFTGGGWKERGAAWLLRTTDPGPVWAEQARQVFEQAGFTTQAERVRLPNSMVLILRASRR